jgi:hypothetical protein
MSEELRLRLISIFLFFCVSTFSSLSSAEDLPGETSKQIWANFILSRPMSEKLYFEYDIEGARQVSGGEPWRYIYGTGLVEYYPSRWVDLTGELTTGFTQQSEKENSFEATARLSIRLHLITQIFNSPLVAKIRPERMSGKRVGIALLSRIERRNFWYDGDRPSSDDVRWRNRLEFKVALNKNNLATDGVWYLMVDNEWFTTLSDDEAPERFATKRRLRAGLGFRRSYQWRFEALAMRDETRETLEGEVDIEALMLDLRIKWFF